MVTVTNIIFGKSRYIEPAGKARFLFLVILLFFFCSYSYSSILDLPGIYSDNMVIQADQPFVIRGRSTPFKVVKVQMLNEIKGDRADQNGNWNIKFSGFKTDTSFEIKVRTEDGEEQIIKNVITGEVWLCSGQSNMQMVASRTDVKDRIIKTNFTGRIRYFNAQNEASSVELDAMKGEWIICTPQNFGNCSAVGLSFATTIYQSLNRPIGLIINARGGTPIESWTKLDLVKGKEYNQHIFMEREQWKRDKELYQSKYNNDLKNWEAAIKKAKQNGSLLPPKIFPPFQLRENWNPGSLYNSLVYPMRDFIVKGVIWYQGESNANYPFVYRYQLTDMINCWRALFKNPGLSFYIVQLPGYSTTEDWPVIRESQSLATCLGNTSLVVTLGLGDSLTIHPIHKMEVGHRVAIQVLNNEYNESLIASAPQVKSIKIIGDKVILDFDCFGSTLTSSDGKPVRNMEIADADFKFLPAKAIIDSNALTVWNDQIKHPENVRYAWESFPGKINFINKEALPVPPFFAGQLKEHLLREQMAYKSKLRVLKYDTASEINKISDFDSKILSRAEIKKYTTGIVKLKRSSEGYLFKRYPEKAIKTISASKVWEIRSLSTSGVVISFITNSEKLFLSGKVILNSPQTKTFHVLCNNKIVAGISEKMQSSGNFYWNILLPEGEKEKEIQIIFPAYSQGILKDLAIQKGATLKKVVFKGNILAYGNSITQMGGEYDGFLTIASNKLGYSLYDAGIGGHIFQAKYLTGTLVKDPGIILVEYGTNDWSGGKKADLAKPFLKRLCSLYPQVPIALIEPLFRFKPLGTEATIPYRNKINQSLEDYRKDLRKIAGEFKQVSIFNHEDLLPENPDLFIDGVHPNKKGQKILGERLAEQIKKLLKTKM
jgi:sialate O-acetylesterase